MFVERILFHRGLSWGCEFERLKDGNPGRRCDLLTIAWGQSVVRLEAKDLLVCRFIPWQSHAIDVLDLRVERNVMQVGSSVQPVVVC